MKRTGPSRRVPPVSKPRCPEGCCSSAFLAMSQVLQAVHQEASGKALYRYCTHVLWLEKLQGLLRKLVWCCSSNAIYLQATLAL